MPSHEQILDACRRAADLLMSHRWKLWFWADGIGLEGLLDVSEITGDDKYLGFVYGMFKAWIPRMQQRSRFDHTGPCVFVDSVHFHGPFLTMLYAITKEDRYLKQAEETIGPQVELLWDE